nr:hypothetical protein [Tanacetum cinerariifolium]
MKELEEEKARGRGKVYKWETTTYGRIWIDDDIHDHRSSDSEFPAIVFNDTLMPEVALSGEPTVSSLYNNEIDFRISFDKSDNEDYTEGKPLIFIIKNLYMPFGIPLDPTWFYKDGV